MGTDFVLQLVKISFTTSILLIVLFALTPLLQKRYSSKWNYFLWIVIAIRLLIPVGISLPTTFINVPIPVIETRDFVSMEDSNVLDSLPLNEANSNLASAVSITEKESIRQFSPVRIMNLVWMIGVVLFLLFQFSSYRFFLSKVRHSHSEEVPASIKELMWQMGVDMGICKLPEPIITSAVDAPVLTGILHLRLLLPHANYTQEELVFILRHELVHHHRRDMWYKLFLMFVNALHWFNPLVYLMVNKAGEDIELACDNDVVLELSKTERASYGETILSTLPRKRSIEPMFSTHFGSTKKTIKSRLKNLFDVSHKKRGFIAFTIVLLSTIIISGTITLHPVAASPIPFSVQRLGVYDVQNGDKIYTNLEWDNHNIVLILYTDKNYSDEDFQDLFYGGVLPNLPNDYAEKIDTSRFLGDRFDFQTAQRSPYEQTYNISQPDSSHIYLICFSSIEELHGEIELQTKSGENVTIWESKEVS